MMYNIEVSVDITALISAMRAWRVWPSDLDLQKYDVQTEKDPQDWYDLWTKDLF